MDFRRKTIMEFITTNIAECGTKLGQAGELHAEAKKILAIISLVHQRIHLCFSLFARHLTFLERDQSLCPKEELRTAEGYIRSLEHQLRDFENSVRNLEEFLMGFLDNINSYKQHLLEKLHWTTIAMSLECLNLITVDPPPECLEKIPEVLSLDTEFKQMNFISRILTLENVVRDIIGDQLID